jgi:hypothetical protein
MIESSDLRIDCNSLRTDVPPGLGKPTSMTKR